MLLNTPLISSGCQVLTGSPERSEYFMAGLKEGGASIIPSETENNQHEYHNYPKHMDGNSYSNQTEGAV